MKRLITLLAFVILVAVFSACGGTDIEGLNRDDALKVLDAKIKKDGKNAELYYQRGKILLEVGKENNDQNRIQQAVSDLEKATELDPEKVDYFTSLGDALFRTGNVAKSYIALQNALKLDENNLDACLMMAELAYYSNNFDRAMESLNKVTEQDKNNQTALFMKGLIYKSHSDTANAVFYFRKLIDIYPDYEPAYEELGLLYAQYKDRLAFEYLNTALELQPRNVVVLYSLAMLYQDLEEADMANEYYVKILEIEPDNKYAWHNRGWLHLVLYEDYPSAIEFFTKAIECDPAYSEAYHNCGVAYEMMGDKNKANEYYKKAQQYPQQNN